MRPLELEPPSTCSQPWERIHTWHTRPARAPCSDVRVAQDHELPLFPAVQAVPLPGRRRLRTLVTPGRQGLLHPGWCAAGATGKGTMVLLALLAVRLPAYRLPAAAPSHARTHVPACAVATVPPHCTTHCPSLPCLPCPTACHLSATAHAYAEVQNTRCWSTGLQIFQGVAG